MGGYLPAVLPIVVMLSCTQILSNTTHLSFSKQSDWVSQLPQQLTHPAIIRGHDDALDLTLRFQFPQQSLLELPFSVGGLRLQKVSVFLLCLLS